MNELILVLFLLINGADGRLQSYGPTTDAESGEVLTWTSHNECYEFGAQLMDGDEKLDGFVCVVKPKSRFGRI